MFPGEDKKTLSNAFESLKFSYCLDSRNLPKPKSLIKVKDKYLLILDELVYAKLIHPSHAPTTQGFLGYFFNCSVYDENGKLLEEFQKMPVFNYELVQENVFIGEVESIIQNLTEN